MKMAFNKQILYEICILLCITINVIYTHICIMQPAKWFYIIYPTDHICFLLLEINFIYFISILFGRFRHMALFILFLLETILLWINVGYSRYFHTYLPLSLYTEFNNLDGLMPNIKDAIEVNDLIFLLTTTIAFINYFQLRTEKVKRLLKNSLAIPLFFVVTITLSFIPHYLSAKKEKDRLHDHFIEFHDKRTTWDIIKYRMQLTRQTDAKNGFYFYGIGLNLFIDIYEKYFTSKKLHYTEEEKSLIKKHLYASNYELSNETKKNLIIILVESLASFPIHLSFDGVEITPNLNKLLSDAYYNPNMESEALLGESSDGQFIYLTGLLPLNNVITINELKTEHVTTFIELAKKQQVHLYSQMIIPTASNTWSQKLMCERYNIDTLFSKEQFTNEKEWLSDKQIFEYAFQHDKSTDMDIIKIILTSSMHSPYTHSIENYHINYPSDFSNEFKHYLDNVHYMDKYLGIYIESLKSIQLYSQSTIIITADHKPNGPKLNDKRAQLCTKIPLIIINPPQDFKNTVDERIIYQTSLFPTILDLLHIESKWRGVGHSIFMPDSTISSPYEQERHLLRQQTSEYLLYTKYL